MRHVPSIWLILSVLLGGPASSVRAADPDVASPLTSYVYLDSLAEMPAQPNVVSPLVSYQYFDSLGTAATYQQSAPVSYFFNAGSSAQSVVLSGRVSDASGAPVAGATVSGAVVETTQASATTASDGSYQMPALPAGVYVLTAAKAGYTRDQRAVRLGEGTTPQDFRLRLSAAPPVTQNTGNAPPFAASSPADIEGSTLVAFDGTGFVPVTGTLDASKMTIVLTHGWNARPEDWPLTLATALKNKGLLPLVNIVAWDWHTAAANLVFPPEEKTPKQGVALGKALYQALGSGYQKPVHFVGHSLGTLLQAYSANYLHGDGDGRQERAAPPWSFAQTHLTLFDEAAISRISGQEIIFDVLGRIYKNGLNLSEASSQAAAKTKNALAGWKTPVPKRSAWVDNYISSVGIYRPDAVNAGLLRGLLNNSGDPISAHSYPQQWYVESIARPTVSAMGFRRSFEYRLLAEGATSAFPPPESELVPGDAQGQVLTAPDELTLEPLPYTRFGELLAPGLTYGPAIGYGSAVQELAGAANKTFNVTLDYAETAALSTLDAVNSLTDAVEKGYQQAVDLLNRSSLRLRLKTGPSGGARLAAQLLTTANDPAYVWLPIAVPADAVGMTFDFKLIGDGMDDSLVFGINGTSLISLETRFLADGESSTSRMLDTTAYAGRTNEFFFGLLGGTSTDCTVEVQNIRFYTLTPPQLGIVQTNGTTAVSWPSTLTGFCLEASASLAPPNWQAVTNQPTLYGEVLTVSGIPSEGIRFFRLRKL